jgi:hypothetical protein
MTRFEELADRLAALGEELDDLSYDLLMEAKADGRTAWPAADRAVTQARRAVEKAVVALRRAEVVDGVDQ